MPQSPQKRERGLAAVHEMRGQRLEGRFSRPTASLWLAAVAALGVILGAYGYFAGRKLDAAKGDLLAKRNAVEATVGAEWGPLRDRLERYTADAAQDPWPGDLVAPTTKGWDFATMPGIYLRLRVADARDRASLRRAAQDALKDGFAGCLIRSDVPALARGEADAAAFGEQPWNLRQAYQSTRILTPEWADEVRASGDDLRLRVFQQQCEKAIETEIPRAIDIVKKARFYLLALDEPVSNAETLASVADRLDGGPPGVDVLQLVPHPVRVVLVDLEKDVIALRIRREVSAGFRFAGERRVTDPETLDAMQRQVQNCALANEVRAAIAAAP
jgi:hypothetical protein